jgi:hypothetical protein
MRHILFVHGTGVRQPSYDDTCSTLGLQLSKFLPDCRLHRCYWGETEGCRLLSGGASIPEYDTARAVGDVAPEDAAIAAWQLLYADPDSEIDAFIAQPGPARQFNPGAAPPMEELRALLNIETEQTLALEGELSLDSVWDKAKDELLAFFSAAVASNRIIPELDAKCRIALARALVAHASILISLSGRNDWPTGQQRDALVDALGDAWGGEDRSMLGAVTGWIGGRFKRMALRIGTNKVARKRGALSDASYPAAGDILLYQARGNGIRGFIEGAVREAPKPLIVLAHSLGGIACVDLFVEKRLEGVVKLITVGSQAPLLYELNALCSLPHPDPLPASFPNWLNIYDKHDFLSYVGASLFPGRTTDVLVDNGQPFPEAHSAYWSNPDVWTAIAGSLP